MEELILKYDAMQKALTTLEKVLQKTDILGQCDVSEDDVFFNIWLKIYNEFVNNQEDKIKIIDAYNIIRLSLEKTFKT